MKVQLTLTVPDDGVVVDQLHEAVFAMLPDATVKLDIIGHTGFMTREQFQEARAALAARQKAEAEQAARKAEDDAKLAALKAMPPRQPADGEVAELIREKVEAETPDTELVGAD